MTIDAGRADARPPWARIPSGRGAAVGEATSMSRTSLACAAASSAAPPAQVASSQAVDGVSVDDPVPAETLGAGRRVRLRQVDLRPPGIGRGCTRPRPPAPSRFAGQGPHGPPRGADAAPESGATHADGLPGPVRERSTRDVARVEPMVEPSRCACTRDRHRARQIRPPRPVAAAARAGRRLQQQPMLRSATRTSSPAASASASRIARALALDTAVPGRRRRAGLRARRVRSRPRCST